MLEAHKMHPYQMDYMNPCMDHSPPNVGKIDHLSVFQDPWVPLEYLRNEITDAIPVQVQRLIEVVQEPER
jgi:hypothetical protein